jgi:hypothetical protein
MLEDVKAARMVTTVIQDGVPQTAMELVVGEKVVRMAEGLSQDEQEWLVNQVNKHIELLQGQPVEFENLPSIPFPKIINDTSSN